MHALTTTLKTESHSYTSRLGDRMNSPAAHEQDQFNRAIERRDGRDFPFYNLLPTEVTTGKWLVIIASTIVAFLLLMFWPAESQVAQLAPRLLFTAIPFVTFALLVRPNWKAIFKPIGIRDIGTMVVFWLLNLVVSLILGSLVRAIFGANDDAAINGIANLPVIEKIAFFVGTGIQIFGEELFTILPFLALLYWFRKAGLGRKKAITFAWIITAIWFGLAHLPAYGWNIIQVILVIGVARIILTLAYIRTKNILVSTGAHVLHDWASFALVMVTGMGISGALL